METAKIIEIIKNEKLGDFNENLSFKDITTLKVGGKIRLVFFPNSIENFKTFYLKIINSNLINPKDIFVIGAGSNVLASDDLFDGLVISFRKLPIKYIILGQNVYCYPQVKTTELSNRLLKKHLSGAEFLNGLPATIGGAVYMNAGGFGADMSDVVESVEMLNDKGEVKEYSKNEMNFKYRFSLAKEKKMIILSVKLKLKSDTYENINNKIKSIKNERKQFQPQGVYSAGCAFKNLQNKKAWELINQANLRGFKINDAAVSNKHCNFLVNLGNAKATDMYNLQKYVKNKVYEETNVRLENEWIMLNFPDSDK